MTLQVGDWALVEGLGMVRVLNIYPSIAEKSLHVTGEKEVFKSTHIANVHAPNIGCDVNVDYGDLKPIKKNSELIQVGNFYHHPTKGKVKVVRVVADVDVLSDGTFWSVDADSLKPIEEGE
ncbi:hypothetical protein FLK61_34225 [Paenalkalicoccus suaedae]|uniref:Uncharacterized protein n=1 Tax=Paenalkalicoccus suaedae TaxID=2592382 RepID=A0A859FHS6_9BACI|nr:hypothetical protein [Paenalkalicoccus suaedae]QKS71682.1 hypothetical protein FLK61_33930 [Paenalkalicoccus suaedae]QKS71736.1 hypothetical protein FLK61_34225 [Paenalkalicoccus suaedae]